MVSVCVGSAWKIFLVTARSLWSWSVVDVYGVLCRRGGPGKLRNFLIWEFRFPPPPPPPRCGCPSSQCS